jgi:predicted porin
VKKKLIALTALATTGVFAQSSLTLFGTADARLAMGNGSAANRTFVTSSGLASSALGFRGVEDLGGGLKASFHLEGSANTDDGTGAATNTANQAAGAGSVVGITGQQGFTFNRRSTVGLGGGWGEVRMGRDYTPHFWNYTFYDPFGTNGVGTTQALAGNLGGVTTVRASNSIAYHGNFSGFGVSVMTYLGENASNAAAGANTGSGSSLRLSYDNGPISAGLGWGKTNTGVNADVTYFNVGGSYDLGSVKLMGNWTRETNQVGAAWADNTGWTFGAVVPMGAGQIRASVSKTANYVLSPASTVQQVALGYVHGLSKRTQLYATVATATGADGGTPSLNGSVGAANSTATGVDLGVKHSF